MGERMRNVPIGAHFILKRTGDRYELLGHKRGISARSSDKGT